MTHDELEQRLWELEYGLLSGDEASALREQIADDSELAQLRDRVRSRMSLVAEAARIQAPRIQLRTPNEEQVQPPSRANARSVQSTEVQSTEVQSTDVQSTDVQSTDTARRIRRGANWILGIAASLMIGVLGWATWSQSDRAGPQQVAQSVFFSESDAKPQSLFIQVDTPSQLSSESKNPIVVSTRAVDGTPQSVGLKLQVENSSGTDLYSKEVTTNQRGLAFVELPETTVDAAKLWVVRDDDVARGLQIPLAAAEPQYATQLSTDKPRYGPGDVVRYRSVTLTRFGLKSDREVAVEYSLTDPAGQELAGSRLTGKTDHGVGNGELQLSADAAPGRYTVIARSPQSVFPETKYDFAVQKQATRQYHIDLYWADNDFAANSEALGKLRVRTPDGQPANKVKLNFRAYVDGKQLGLSAPEVATDASGNADVRFGLPPELKSSEGSIGIQAGEQDVVWKDIPLQADQVQVDFYPEGGDLTAGVENRVYFHCHDFDGHPIAVQGKVLDASGHVISNVTTQHEGRGAFRFTPQAAATYSMQIDEPPSVKSKPALPPVMEPSHLVLDAGSGVFDASSPIRLKLRSREVPSEISVVANCRGVTVGQQTSTSSDFENGICDVNLPVIDEAAGILRVTVFDYSKQPPEPLAERLVYRYPQRKLHLQLTDLSDEYSTGDSVRGQVAATDESGKPVSAVLGISAVDERVLELADRTPARITTQFLLLGDVYKPEKLEDANFYLSSDPAAAVSLDLLLGTQGWRRFDRIPANRMAFGLSSELESLAQRDGIVAEAAKLAKTIVDGEAEKSLDLLGTDRVIEAALGAPRRFDNRELVEELERKSRADEVRAVPVQGPASNDSVVRPVLAVWVIPVCCGLLAILGIGVVIRQRPTKRVLVGGLAFGGGLGVLSLLLWLTPNGAAQRGNVAIESRFASTAEKLSEVPSEPEPTAGAGSYRYFDSPDKREKYLAPQVEPAASFAAPFVADPEAMPKKESGTISAPANAPPAPTPVADEVFEKKQNAADRAPATPAPAATTAPAPAPAPTDKVQPQKPKASQPDFATPPPPPVPAVAEVQQEKVRTSNPAPAARPESPSRMLAPSDPKPELRASGMGGLAAPGGASPKNAEKGAEKDSEKDAAMKQLLEVELLRSRHDSYITEDDTKKLWNRPANRFTLDRSESGKGLIDGFGAKAAEQTDARKMDRAELAPANPRGLKSQPADSVTSFGDQFYVRRYASLRSKDNRDRDGKDYSESVLWNPLLITDEQGRAEFEFDLPDTVTRFRITADGHSDGRLGGAEQSLKIVEKK